MKRHPSVIHAFHTTMPVFAGYIFLGIAYGIAMQSRGLGVSWSALVSVCVYGGSLQFAMIEAMTGAMEYATFAILCLLIQARHLFYGLSMLNAYGKLRTRPYLIFALTDETYSLVCRGAPEGVHAEPWYLCVSLFDQCWWVSGTVLGALAGRMIPVAYLTGIDFSMTALFLVICAEQMLDALEKKKKGEYSWQDVFFAPVLGFAGTLISLWIFGKTHFLLASMAIILSGFFLRYFLTERRGNH